ncbi:MAG: hypothetical protein L0H53_11535 [Candidatus Nitrosocosmicus sp.]|nr:hypothetical protein [Candidatus Nitrosocosmicus sp.]MDN5866838.1 hypothetical protein [Candidatus Nitrosocosmicus sp.]
MAWSSRYGFIDDKVPPPPSSQMIVCLRCNRKNKFGSHYCDQCGQSLLPSCRKCGNTKNLPNIKFCNQCGVKIEKHLNDENKKNQDHGEDRSKNKQDPSFLECSLIKYDIRFKYPSIFLNAKKPRSEPNTVLVFQNVDRNFYIKQPPTIALLIREFKADQLDLKKLTEIEIQRYLSRETKTTIIGCFPIVLGKFSAYQVIYGTNELREICIYTLNQKRLYIITFKAEENSYAKLLYLFEQLKDSFEFLP